MTKDGEIVYGKRNFIIVKESKGFIVINTKKNFNRQGHSHIQSFKRAKDLVRFAISKTIPSRPSLYVLQSLIRISTDKKYIKEIELEIDRLRIIKIEMDGGTLNER